MFWFDIKAIINGTRVYQVDYDPERENGRLHPLYHVDINYSTKGTYKLGMNKKMETAEFIDMLDTKTDCRYVQ